MGTGTATAKATAIHTITTTGTAMATVTNTPTEATAPQVDDLALLGLMQLVSPALPIGAFAWSQGLESAFELGWVNNEAELAQWIEGVLEDGLSPVSYTHLTLPTICSV